jgi:hypothetical protein
MDIPFPQVPLTALPVIITAGALLLEMGCAPSYGSPPRPDPFGLPTPYQQLGNMTDG